MRTYYLETTSDMRKELQKLFNKTESYVCKAVNYKLDNDTSRRIRKAAKEKGAVEVVVAPLCETIHVSDGLMQQTFPNGYEIIADIINGSVRVLDGDSEEIESYSKMTISEFGALQARIGNL